MSEYICNTEDKCGMCEVYKTAEPIVRCRNCKHYTEDEAEYYHYCGEWCEQVEPDGFCAWGEREQDGK